MLASTVARLPCTAARAFLTFIPSSTPVLMAWSRFSARSLFSSSSRVVSLAASMSRAPEATASASRFMPRSASSTSAFRVAIRSGSPASSLAASRSGP
ncbi:MAG: hypothetical protein HYU30_11015 [Chloroflexi bacterium]|nr:hypothetical protein [Chloroflexota bacterium]